MSRKQIKQACQAHTDLTVFASIVAILEGGCIYTDIGHTEARRIITRCKAIQQRLLRQMDASIEAASKGANHG